MLPYRHTQRGWFILGSLLIPVAVLSAVALSGRTWVPLLGLFPIALIIPLVSSLTVAVDEEAVELHFGVGLLRRRIALGDIESVAPVRTSWVTGWGIRVVPGRRVYNVSGFAAVELRLINGTIARIGTDDQAGLLAAVQAAMRLPARASADVAPSVDRTLAWIGVFVVGVTCAAVAVVGTVAATPADVRTSASALDVSGAGYHAHVPMSDIVRVHLDDQLPPIRYRSNGFSAQGRLRGHFTLSDGRAAQVFVRKDRPPFITVETRRDPVIFNLDDAAQTRALYQQLAR